MSPDHVKADSLNDVFDKDLFFIVGVPKSGTTWLQRIFDTSPEIVCRGESHFMNILYPALSSALANYNKDVAQFDDLGRHSEMSNCRDVIAHLGTNEEHYVLVSAIALMFDKWLDKPGVRYIGEKTPNNLIYMQTLGTIFPSARFIHIIRDGRDAAVSGWFYNISNLEGPYETHDTFDSYVTRFAAAWKALINEGRKAGIQLGNRYREVLYENLVTDPYRETGELLAFLGADSSDEIVRRCVDDNRFEQLSGGRRPGNEKRDAFFRKGVPGDWRNHMSKELIQAFEDQAGDLLESLGYGAG